MTMAPVSFLLILVQMCAAIKEIYLRLNGKDYYNNNSVVTLTDIGNHLASALICHTNISDCCGFSNKNRGRWYYPSGEPVRSNPNTTEPFTRGRGKGMVTLYRRKNESVPPSSGIYKCEIRIKNSTTILQELFVGLYPAFSAVGTPTITSLKFDSSLGAVVCISRGGPVEEVTWNRKAKYKKNQRITNTSSATYYNILSVNSTNLEDYTGLFACTVSNSRGNDTLSMRLKAIEVSYQKVYPEGSVAELLCFSDISAKSITWYAEQKQVAFTTSQQRFTLTIPEVTAGYNNTEYTCVINIVLLPQQVEIKVNGSFILKVTSGPGEINGWTVAVGIICTLLFATAGVGSSIIAVFLKRKFFFANKTTKTGGAVSRELNKAASTKTSQYENVNGQFKQTEQNEAYVLSETLKKDNGQEFSDYEKMDYGLSTEH